MSAVERAYVLIRTGRAKEALETLAADFDPDDVWSWHARGAALVALERHEDAARAAESGLAVDAEDPFLLDLLAAARIGLGDFAGAEKAILEALSLDAEDPDFLTRYAHIVARVGQMEKADKLVRRALSIDPENAFALRMHALLATAQADRGEAIARSRELLRHVPEDAVGYQLLGAAHSDGGQVDAAADHFTRAVQLDPTDNDLADAARESRARSHWLLWPLRPVMRWGPAPTWIAAMAILFTLRAMKLERAMAVALVVWLVYCVYSWTMPSLVRRLSRR